MRGQRRCLRIVTRFGGVKVGAGGSLFRSELTVEFRREYVCWLSHRGRDVRQRRVRVSFQSIPF